MFIKLHELDYKSVKPADPIQGEAFFVNPEFLSLVERSDIPIQIEGPKADRGRLFFHAFEGPTNTIRSVVRNCFESTSEIMEKIAEAEKRQ